MQNNSFISNSKVIKRIFAVIGLFLTVCMIFSGYMKIVRTKGIPLFDGFYSLEKESVDVLCVGSSHVYCSINPVQMYGDYGIAAFDLAGGSQAIWYSYHYMKEALKTQKPEVIVLDVYTTSISDDAYFDSKVQMNLLNMKPSYNKWEVLQTAEVENRGEVFWEFPITHSKYSTLKSTDYDGKDETKLLGYFYSNRIVEYTPEQIRDVSGVTESEPISAKTEEYLRKCIELCQKENIEIVLTNAPWADITLERQKYYNYVQMIADEYGVPFVNACLYTDEIGLDYMVDSMGDGGHLNYTGATKYTKWLCDYLKENYDLQDRRGDERYSLWMQEAERLNAIVRRDKLASISDINQYLDAIKQNEDIYCVISLKGNLEQIYESPASVMANRGIDLSQSGVYVMNGKETLFDSNGELAYKWYKELNDSVLYIYEEDGAPIVSLDRVNYARVENGVNILVYDATLGEIIGNKGLDAVVK